MDKLIGRRIQQIREKQHYSREALAEKIDISSKFLYEIEKGKKSFSVEILIRLSDLLNVSCDYILTGRDRSVVEKTYFEDISALDGEQREYAKEVITLLGKICRNTANN